MEYISKFGDKTNSGRGGFFAKLLAHHMRKFGKTHIFIYSPVLRGWLLERQNANWALFKPWGFDFVWWGEGNP